MRAILLAALAPGIAFMLIDIINDALYLADHLRARLHPEGKEGS